MDPLKILIIVVVILIGAPIVFVFFKNLKKAQDEIKVLIEERFKKKTIRLHDPFALHVAQESRGYSQDRGNGNLILTDHELFFAMTFPKTIVSIPIQNIIGTERVMRMGGKCIMKTLLKINFKTSDGKRDAYGFHLKELDRWESEIQKRSGLAQD